VAAQEIKKIQQTKTRSEIVKKDRFNSDQITAFVDGHQTKIEVLSLFKPAEITMKSKKSAAESMEQLTMLIEVQDKSHPVLQYFQNKARLYYKGHYYGHNVLPEIKPNSVKEVEYHQYDDPTTPGKLDDYLEVVLYGEEYMPHEQIKYKTERKRIQYYDVDGKIYLAQDIPKLHLKAGEFTTKMLSGKEAVEKYGDAKYAEGINVVRTIKK